MAETERKPGIEFKIHDDGNSVQIRISEAQNGLILKAGKKPYLCGTPEEVKSAVNDVVDGYFDWLKKNASS